jgi:hypothetical protein
VSADAAFDTETLVARFIGRTLPKGAWTHRAHLRVGLWHVRRFGPDRALDLLRERIARYNESVGTANTDTSGYHETLTVVYVRLIADFAGRGCSPTRPVGRGSNPATDDLEARLVAALDDRAIPLRYYSRERLFSTEARRHWVPPDLESFGEFKVQASKVKVTTLKADKSCRKP